MTRVRDLGQGVKDDGWLKWARPIVVATGEPANRVVIDFDYDSQSPEWSTRATESFLAWLDAGEAGEAFKNWSKARTAAER